MATINWVDSRYLNIPPPLGSTSSPIQVFTLNRVRCMLINIQCAYLLCCFTKFIYKRCQIVDYFVEGDSQACIISSIVEQIVHN